MPYACKKPCLQQGCPALVDKGRCLKHEAIHKKMVNDRTKRGRTARQAYSDTRWRRLRKMYLNEYPLCVTDGCNQLATNVDHIIRREAGGDDSYENLQAFCQSCHSRKTAMEDGAFGHKKKDLNNEI